MLGHPGHDTLAALRKGKVIDLDGVLFVIDEGKLAPGGTYVGARNTVDVYTCSSVDTERGWVNSEGSGYPFDLGECVKVRFAPDGVVADYTVPAECLHWRPAV